MIDYGYLCQAIEHWRSGGRPATPPLPSSEYEELDADVMVDDELSSQDEQQAGYEQAGYEQAGYEQAGYEHAEQAPAEYEEPGYDQPQDAGQQTQGYEDADYERPQADDETMAYGESVSDIGDDDPRDD